MSTSIHKPITRISVPTRKLTLISIWIAFLAYFIFTIFPKLNWVWTDSVPYYLMWHEPGVIQKNDYVVYEFTNYLNDMKRVMVTKQARCMPGDSLRTINRAFYCNGGYIGKAKEFALSGTRLEFFDYNGKIPDGKVFLMTDHIDGFDSRYWGLISIDKLERVVPII